MRESPVSVMIVRKFPSDKNNVWQRMDGGSFSDVNTVHCRAHLREEIAS